VSQGKNWLSLDATVKEAESLFKTEYYVFEHDTGKPHIACDGYSLPSHLSSKIDFVTPTVHFDAKIKREWKSEKVEKRNVVERVTSKRLNLGLPGNNVAAPKLGAVIPNAGTRENSFGALLANCSSYIVPNCLRALYGFNPNTASAVNTQNSYGIVEYTPQHPSYTDLDLWYSLWSGNPALRGTRPNLVSIDGGSVLPDSVYGGFSYVGESNLDLMYGISLVAPQPVTLFQVGDPVEGASFNDFLDAFDASYCAGDDYTQDGVYPDPYNYTGAYKGPKDCGDKTISKVISTSYGYNEADLTRAYQMRQCNEYMKFGLLGTTFIYSSGRVPDSKP